MKKKTAVLHSFFLSDMHDDAFFFPFFFDGKPVSGLSCGLSRGISCTLSARNAGNMDVRETGRRNAFLQKAGVDPAKTFACSQTHSQNVAVVDGRVADGGHSGGILCDADGLASYASGASGAADNVWLSVTVADCLPVYMLNVETGAFSVVHSGWKGTGIVLNALKSMNAEAHPETVSAVLGPCICGDCYRVDEERRRVFDAQFGREAHSPSAEYPLGNVVKGDCLDLKAANAALLANAGVRNIAYCENCTFTDERLGSFRREGNNFTKMMAVIGRSCHVHAL
ncbi:MAG: polyphenol oxidase family protein [Treponema sp.]|jgi:YfiH family protein|nr:polyphenol oxidase family protein [Treponema sp.]